jgi:hypothetical protein
MMQIVNHRGIVIECLAKLVKDGDLEVCPELC